MKCPRVVWRVLADPKEVAGAYEDQGFHESFHLRATEAFLEARTLEAEKRLGVEVNRCVLPLAVTVMDLLNRRGVVDRSTVVEPETWRVAIKRVRPVGAAKRQEAS